MPTDKIVVLVSPADRLSESRRICRAVVDQRLAAKMRQHPAISRAIDLPVERKSWSPRRKYLIVLEDFRSMNFPSLQKEIRCTCYRYDVPEMDRSSLVAEGSRDYLPGFPSRSAPQPGATEKAETLTLSPVAHAAR